MAKVKDVESKLKTHEAVCAERWKETIERIFWKSQRFLARLMQSKK